jgi:hypothetical protein
MSHLCAYEEEASRFACLGQPRRLSRHEHLLSPHGYLARNRASGTWSLPDIEILFVSQCLNRQVF